MKKIFSGIQPSGNIHLGNYLGALKQWVKTQDEAECIFCIVDLHAITVEQNPKTLKEKILELAALYLACGIDPNKSTIFVQSDRPEHSELAWIINCHASMGELNRMTQFKEKAEGKDKYSVGLFDYPALMAADILLYQTDQVPVGEDQKQHVELTRNIAQRMNNRYGEIFTIPEPVIRKETARIMALDDSSKKMSKSAESTNSYIALTDNDETIRNKIKRAVTDSGSEIKADPSGTNPAEAKKPALTNLLNIFSAVTGKSVNELEAEFNGKNYGEFKDALADAVIAELSPIRQKFEEIIADKEALKKILKDGASKVAPEAQATLKKVKKAVGLGL